MALYATCRRPDRTVVILSASRRSSVWNDTRRFDIVVMICLTHLRLYARLSHGAQDSGLPLPSPHLPAERPADGLRISASRSPPDESEDIEISPSHHNRSVNRAVQINIDFKLDVDVIDHSKEDTGATVTDQQLTH